MLLFAFAMSWVGATAELMAGSVEVEKLWYPSPTCASRVLATASTGC